MLRLALIALTGCTTPAVDRETAGFNAEKFSQDLEFCRGGTATAFALKTVGGTLYGSFKGAVVGLHLGVIAGDGIEGMIIGAAAGGVAGLGLGAKEYLDDQTNTVVIQQVCTEKKWFSHPTYYVRTRNRRRSGLRFGRRRIGRSAARHGQAAQGVANRNCVYRRVPFMT